MFCPYPSLFDPPGNRLRLVLARAARATASGASTAAGINESSINPARFVTRLLRRAKSHSEGVRELVSAKTWSVVGPLLLAAGWLWFGGVALGSQMDTNPPRTSDYDYDPPAPGSYTLPVIKPAADGEVLDVQGNRRQLRELTRGRITVMSFIYTRCAAAKACPYATGVLRQLHRLSAGDPALARQMRLISMSFDPVNDTPERMAAYAAPARLRSNAADWQFVTASSPEKLRPILDDYGQAVDRKKNPFDPTGPLNHSLRVFLIDRAGNIRNIYSSGTLDLRLVLADMRTLMMEEAKAASGNGRVGR